MGEPRYKTIKEVIDAKARGDLPHDVVWMVDNDNVRLMQRVKDKDDDGEELEDIAILRIGYGPWVVLEEVLAAIGFDVESV